MSGPWEKYAAPAEAGPWAQYRTPAPAPAEVAPDPTAGMSTFDKLAAGAGKSVADTGRGLGQLLRSAIETVAPPQKTTADLVAGTPGRSFADTLGLPTQADVDEAAARDKALMNTGAGTIGNVVGQVAQMAVPGAVVGKVAGAAPVAARVLGNPVVQSAIQSGAFAAAQPVLTGDSRLGNAATGAALGAGGQVVGSAIGAVGRGASNAIAPEVKALAARAEQLGIPINAAQLGDSKFIKTVQSALERLPFTGAGKAREAQQEAFNRAVSRTFGEDVGRITDDVYAGAKTRIGQQFNDLTARNALNGNDPTLLANLAGVTDDARRFATDDTAKAVSAIVDEFLGKADAAGQIPGRAYQALDSQIGQLTKSGGEKALYLGKVREALRNAMDGSISAADRDAWQLARSQYKNLKTVRDLVAKDAVDGNIAPGLLRGRVTASQAGKEALASGRAGDLGDLANIGSRFLRDPIPDSGTAQRQLVNGLLLGGGGAGLAFDPQSTIAAALLAGTVGRGTNAALNSRAVAGYLQNGVQSPIARALLQRAEAASPLLIPATANALQQ